MTNLYSISTTIHGYVSSLSTHSTLKIKNKNTSKSYLNHISNIMLGLIYGHTTGINNLQITSTPILGYVNSSSKPQTFQQIIIIQQ